MKVVVIGAGKIGKVIVASLVSEGHDVTVIDNNPSVIASITNVYDVMGIAGSSIDQATLNEAGVSNARLVIAVTGSDEMNMLACFISRKMGAHHTIARVRNPELDTKEIQFMKESLNLSMAINPELLTAEEIFKVLQLPSAIKVETFSRRSFEMIQIRLDSDSDLVGHTTIEIKNKFPGQYLIGIVGRGEEVFIPDGHFRYEAGDIIGILASPQEIIKTLKAWGELTKHAKNAMIIGGSRTAVFLAKMLANAGVNVKIIDKDAAKCDEIADVLPKAVVLNGDGASQELLDEEGISNQDAFISLTGMDEENILLSIYAQTQNVPKVISKVNRDELGDLAVKLGVDSIVSPKKVISDIIVRYARALNNSEGSKVETLYQIMDGKAEAAEFVVEGEFPELGKPLRDLRFKHRILIGGIIRGRKAIVPSGNDTIEMGDHVVVLTTEQGLNDFKDIFR